MDREFGDIRKCTSMDMLFGYCTGIISALGGHDVIDSLCEAKKNIKVYESLTDSIIRNKDREIEHLKKSIIEMKRDIKSSIDSIGGYIN